MINNSDWQSRLGSLLENMGGVDPQDKTPEKEDTRARQSGKLTVSYERKGRAGKSATIISGFTLPDDEVAELASAIKKSLGTGGSARGGEILIQGDRRDDVKNFLKLKGYKV